jgi:hypothetical protein
MTFKEKLNKFMKENLSPEDHKKVSEFFKFNTPPLTTPPTGTPQATPVTQGGEAKLKDGTVIKYDTPALAIGSTLTVITPEGEASAPNGDHEAENGDIITVVDGKVTDLKPAAPATPAVPAMPEMVAQMKAEFEKQLKENSEAADKKYNELKTQFEAQTKAHEELKEKFLGFSTFFEESLGIPSAEPITIPANKPVSLSKKEKLLNKFKK